MIESHLGPGGVRLRPLGLVQRLENSSLWQQNKAQPSICVIFNNSCRENVFKARTSSLVYASEVSPQPQRPPGGQGLSPLSLSISLLFFIPPPHSPLCFSQEVLPLTATPAN